MRPGFTEELSIAMPPLFIAPDSSGPMLSEDLPLAEKGLRDAGGVELVEDLLVSQVEHVDVAGRLVDRNAIGMLRTRPLSCRRR